MAGVTAANGVIDAATKTQAFGGVVDTTFRNAEVLGRFHLRPDTGGSTFNRKVAYGLNTSVVRYVEGDAAGAPGAQSYATAQWPFTYYKCTVQFTGHARDQLNNGNPQAAFFDQLAMEFTSGSKDMIDKASTDALGAGLTSPVGIQGIADDAGSLAGLDRATYTWWKAYENTSSTTVTLADIDTFDQVSRDADYASNYDQVWCGPKQIRKLRGAIVLAGQANNSIKIDSGGTIKLSSNGDGIMYGSSPFVPIRDLDNSIMIGVPSSELFLIWRRQMQVELLGKTDDSDKYLITMALCIGADNPKHFWKLTGLTA